MMRRDIACYVPTGQLVESSIEMEIDLEGISALSVCSLIAVVGTPWQGVHRDGPSRIENLWEKGMDF